MSSTHGDMFDPHLFAEARSRLRLHSDEGVLNIVPAVVAAPPPHVGSWGHRSRRDTQVRLRKLGC